MTDRARRLHAIAMLIASCAAILATTPGEPTASAAVEGDVGVGPDDPAEIVVLFVVEPSDQMDRGSIRFSSGFYSSPVTQDVTADADGVPARAGDDPSVLVLPIRVCRDGCEVELRAMLTWRGEPGDVLRARWTSELSVVYENAEPPGEPVKATIVEGHGPAAGRIVWLLTGALAALLTGAGWIVLGGRLPRLRLGLAALSVLPPLWGLGQVATLDVRYLLLDEGTLITLAVAALLVAALAVGLGLTSRGSSIALPAAGWTYLVVVAFLLVLAVIHFATYRPHEVALLVFGFLAPGVAAVTAVPPGGPIASLRLRLGTSFVLASVVAELAVAVAAACYIVLSFVLLLARGSGGDPTAALVAVVPIVIAVGFVIGLRRWFSDGGRLALGLASGVTLLVLVPPLIFIAGGQGGLTVFPDVTAAMILVCFAVNLLGLIGLVVFPTPADARPRAPHRDRERDEERGEGQQVARIPGEPDLEG